MNPSALVITFLTCVLLAITDGFIHLHPRCQCTGTAPHELSDDRIVKIEIFPAGPHCKVTEVIATMKFRKEFTVCLNPNHEWVRKALKKRTLTP